MWDIVFSRENVEPFTCTHGDTLKIVGEFWSDGGSDGVVVGKGNFHLIGCTYRFQLFDILLTQYHTFEIKKKKSKFATREAVK